MPYSIGTKISLGRSRLINYDPLANSGGETADTGLLPRVLFYDNGVRTVPIMHRAFKNLEEKYASTLVAAACAIGDRAASELRVLDIGYGLGYSTQKFFELEVGTYHCVEVNDSIYQDATNHNYNSTPPETYQMFFNSWESHADEYKPDGDKNPGYDIIYYSPCDDFNNMALFDRLRNVCRQNAILGIQGIPLFSDVNLGDFAISTPSGTAPDSDSYDSNFTYAMYTALNNIGYFSIYYQYLNCTTGDGGMFEAIETDCTRGTWLSSPPRIRG